MSKFPPPDALTGQVVQISQLDRWQVYRRLQELTIPCCCPNDGSLRVEVNNSIDAVLVRSTVLQFIASRSELIDWLERCWKFGNW
ncbi:MAG TPA: hypothetical protein DCY88_23005 [Cyanobacteria bacterium UBA11372]|jgi:hypothetical protein|nr:hypothetical protein [Cyanobacteria bacterium UBA11372]